jgi:hypothetical protein
LPISERPFTWTVWPVDEELELNGSAAVATGQVPPGAVDCRGRLDVHEVDGVQRRPVGPVNTNLKVRYGRRTACHWHELEQPGTWRRCPDSGWAGDLDDRAGHIFKRRAELQKLFDRRVLGGARVHLQVGRHGDGP